MQYTITHSCGHEEMVQLYGKGSERDSRRAWMEKQPCLDCKRGQRNATVQAEAVVLDLAELTGSEKQIAWAKKIRQDFIDQFEKRIPQQHKDAADAPRARAAFIQAVNSHTDSRFWIDHRNETISLFASEYEAAFKTEK